MNEITRLLNASKQEFEDKIVNSTAIPCQYLPASNGMAYLVKDDAHSAQVSVAIHTSVDVIQHEDGIYDTGSVGINTLVDLFSLFEVAPQIVIIDYNGFLLSVNKSGEFNAVANIWHYLGEILLSRNSPFIILKKPDTATIRFSGPQGTVIPANQGATNTGATVTVRTATGGVIPVAGYLDLLCTSTSDISVAMPANSMTVMAPAILHVTCTNPNAGTIYTTGDTDVTTLLLSDSTILWLALASEFEIPVFPSFVSMKNILDPYLSVTIVKSEPLGPVRLEEDNILMQQKTDKVRLHLVNATLNQAQLIAKKIWDSTLKTGTFGIADFPAWMMINEYTQPGFGLKQNIRTMELTINYWLASDTSDVLKYITEVITGIRMVTDDMTIFLETESENTLVQETEDKIVLE